MPRDESRLQAEATTTGGRKINDGEIIDLRRSFTTEEEDGTYTAKEAKEAGFTPKEWWRGTRGGLWRRQASRQTRSRRDKAAAKTAGFKAIKAAVAGFTAEQITVAGYTRGALAEALFTQRRSSRD